MIPGGSAAPASSVEEAIDQVRRQGGRATASRQELLRILFATNKHQTAEELASQLQSFSPDVHLSTIYRNLEELERLGIITHTHLGHGPAAYHLATAVHGHLLCEMCGSIIEAPSEMFDDLKNAALEKYGFTIDPHHFAVLGRCSSCK